MDLSSMWLPELGMEDTGFVMNQYDKMSKPYERVHYFSGDSVSSENYTENECLMDRSISTPTSFEEQAEMKFSIYQKTTNINISSQTPKPPASTTLSSLNTFTLSFGDLKPKVDIRPFEDSMSYESSGTGKVSTITKTRVQSYDHVLAERNRRLKLNRHFVSLSTMLPNLKKMDKASVLEDATDYIRKLQERVKELEGFPGVQRKDAHESIIALKRSRLSDNDDDDSSSSETKAADRCVDTHCNSFDNMEVRMSGSSVLVRIQSQKNSSLLVKAVSMMEKLGLSIISSSAVLFANTTTVITIVAQIEDDLYMTATDLVKNLQQAL